MNTSVTPAVRGSGCETARRCSRAAARAARPRPRSSSARSARGRSRTTRAPTRRRRRPRRAAATRRARATTCIRYSEATDVSPVQAAVDRSATSYQTGAACQSRSSWKSVMRYGAFGKTEPCSAASQDDPARTPRRAASYTKSARSSGIQASVSVPDQVRVRRLTGVDAARDDHADGEGRQQAERKHDGETTAARRNLHGARVALPPGP